MDTTLESVIDARERAEREAGFTPDRLACDRSLAVNRERYKWHHIPGMPPFSKHNLEVEELQAKGRLGYDYSMSVLNGVLSGLAWARDKSKQANRLSHYLDAYALRRKPEVVNRWRTDAEFARQRLNGVNPLLLRRIDAIPEKFAVSEERVRNVLPGGVTLRSLLAEGRLFLCDWADLEGCPVAFGRFLSAPLALFWLDHDRELMPLAIQLAQSIDTAKVVFTPSDEPWLWLTARTHVQAADAALHEIVSHLFRTHFTMETVFVAMCRALPPQHPLYRFLAPHFDGTIYINRGARETMIVPGGPIDESIAVGTDGAYWLIAQAWRNFSFSDLDPHEDLRRRGVHDTDPASEGTDRYRRPSCELNGGPAFELQSHGLTGVQARHYDGHDYMAQKRRALEILVREVCEAWVSTAQADAAQGRRKAVGMGPKGETQCEEAGVSG